MPLPAPIRQNKLWLLGLPFLLASLVVFWLPIQLHYEDSGGGLFIFNYLLAIVYTVIVLLAKRLGLGRRTLASTFILLILALISCYSLNRLIPVFDESVTWWCVLLIISCLSFLTLPVYDELPFPLRFLVCAIAGIAFIAFLYLTIYLIPVYFYGAIGAIALGIGLHSFVPILFVIFILLFLRRAVIADKRAIIAFLLGIVIAISVTAQFAIRWRNEISHVDDILSKHGSDNNLPSWVALAQHMEPSPFNERFLKSGLVYKTAGNWDFSFFPGHHQFNEQDKHDPLIMIASFFYGSSSLEDNDRIKILEGLYDSRHQAQERLWSGDDLATTRVDTDVELWPQLHLSYTEENIFVTNKALRTNGRQTEEALYSFHLPEGAVVSSLSLWINGKEEKAQLSSRHKADSAYTTIVGYENRDPSVLHWQEGNIVTVRVFPVRSQETRHFKIGITAPLSAKDTRLVFHSSYFDGPPADGAKAAVHIHPMQALPHADPFPPKDGVYNPDWSLQFDDPGIANASFEFNGNQYTSSTYIPQYDQADIRQFYLDINKSWTHAEYALLLDALAGKKIYAIQPGAGLVAITDANKEQVFKDDADQQFSLFPLPVITDKEHSLLISKSTPTSPSLSDLKDFSNDLPSYLAAPGRLRLYNLGDELSPYLKALKECGAFHFDKGDTVTLIGRLKEKRFIQDTSSPDLTVIDVAGLVIRKSDPSPNAPHPAQAPDHLLRLFAYKQIMEHMEGRLPGDYRYEDPDTVDSLVQTAGEAHIVSPVSSLVVLEKAEDYKRFDIKESQNSLKNASLHQKGSVPEPGQWALLLVAVAAFTFIRLQKTRSKQSL